jgi:hypothetical protein
MKNLPMNRTAIPAMVGQTWHVQLKPSQPLKTVKVKEVTQETILLTDTRGAKPVRYKRDEVDFVERAK